VTLIKTERKRLSRRFVLRGLAGATLALPALELMSPREARGADGTPKRFLLAFGGMPTGCNKFDGDHITPKNTGADYDLPIALQGLATYDVQSQFTIVTNLEVPAQTSAPGGRSVPFHYNTLGPVVAGTKGLKQAGGHGYPSDSSADVRVSELIAGDTPFPLLSYRVQYGNYTNGSLSNPGTGGGPSSSISWRKAGNDAEPIDPLFSPRQAYEAMMTLYTPGSGDDAKAFEAERQRRKSALDLVAESTSRLLPRLGSVDRQRMERHFDELRALENRIEEISGSGGAGCSAATDPGEDPPPNFDASYSNEEARALAFVDLIAFAFACDLSRSVGLMFTKVKSKMRCGAFTDYNKDIHAFSHSEGWPVETGLMNGWHVGHLARLVGKLQEIPAEDGLPLIDHTALALTFEGGHGFDPDGQLDLKPHSTENMTVVLAGGAGGLKRGIHVRTDRRHPAEAILTAMRAVGYEGPLGDLDQPIEDLLPG
jgi:hypothetical protein